MAQPNVAREPSMEEILASIRRIIESNEPGAEAVKDPSLGGEEDEIELADDECFRPDFVANDPGTPIQSESSTLVAASAARPIQSEQRGLSLADVAARVRAASARQQEMNAARIAQAPAPTPVVEQASVLTEAAETLISEAAFEAGREAAASVEAWEAPFAPEPAPASQAQARDEYVPRRSEPEPQAIPLVSELSRRLTPASEPVFRDEPAPAQSLPSKIEETASLLSAEAGAQVARSFTELASVFNGMERRSLEEMAQEMLRPMLQEWLDDNLPTLVERLVREEIERVARGPHR